VMGAILKSPAFYPSIAAKTEMFQFCPLAIAMKTATASVGAVPVAFKDPQAVPLHQS
jgi:hypothetical protein